MGHILTTERDDLQNSNRPRKAAWKRIFIICFASAFLLLAAGTGIYVIQLARSFDTKTPKIDNAFPAEAGRPTKPNVSGPAAINFLVLGSDSLTLPPGRNTDSGAGSDQRSDTMMLVHVPADRKNVYIMSVMRDTWVDIPGHGQAKINAALAYGGIPLVVQTFEGLFGSRIDHVATIDIQGFKALTDALGGVQVNVPYSFKSSSHISFQAGTQTLSGTQALAFVRERHAFADGDYQRVKDQQIFLKAAISRFLTPETLSNPVTVSNIVQTVSPYVSVDSSLDASTIGALALELRNVRGSDISSFTLPNKGTGWSPDGQQSIVVKDDDAIRKVRAAIKNDDLRSYLQTPGLLLGH